jgi:hypothetical protein
MILTDSNRPPRRLRGRSEPPRLAVFGVTAADVVTAVGGFVCDHVMAGWNVMVVLEEPDDDPAARRGLRILGVTATDLDSVALPLPEWPDVLLIAAPLYSQRGPVRRQVAVTSRRPTTELLLWGGDTGGAEFAGWVRSPRRMSYAAMAFKQQALRALNAAGALDETERVLCRRDQVSPERRGIVNA